MCAGVGCFLYHYRLCVFGVCIYNVSQMLFYHYCVCVVFCVCLVFGVCVCCEVLTSLLVNGETQDEVSLAGRSRTSALFSLLHLHPPSSPHAQSLSLTHHKHPTLALTIALSAEETPDSGTGMGRSLAPPPTPTGVVTLLHDIIITGDEETRTWFSQYMKLMQQKVYTAQHIGLCEHQLCVYY